MTKRKKSIKRGTLQKDAKYSVRGIFYEKAESLTWLLNEDNMLASLAECVQDNDLKSVIEVVCDYKYARKVARQREQEASEAQPASKAVRKSPASKPRPCEIGPECVCNLASQ